MVPTPKMSDMNPILANCALWLGLHVTCTLFGILCSLATTGGVCVVPDSNGFVRIESQSGIISDNAFQSCALLVSVNVTNSVSMIGSSSFYGCSNLISVDITDSVVFIGSFAFQYCSSLPSITIPESVTYIGNSALNGCTMLSTVSLSDRLMALSGNLFASDRRLASIYIPGSVTTIGNGAFLRVRHSNVSISPTTIVSLLLVPVHLRRAPHWSRSLFRTVSFL